MTITVSRFSIKTTILHAEGKKRCVQDLCQEGLFRHGNGPVVRDKTYTLVFFVPF